MGITLHSTQSEENRRLKAGKTGLFLINHPILPHAPLYNIKTQQKIAPLIKKEAAF